MSSINQILGNKGPKATYKSQYTIVIVQDDIYARSVNPRFCGETDIFLLPRDI